MTIVLLGDSIFDNAAYTAGGPAVIDHLRAGLGVGEEASLLAVDGDRVRDVPRQLQRIPQGATHFFLSIGGNDALGRVELLNRRVETVGRGISLLGREVDGFEEEYGALENRPEHYANPIEPSVEGGRVLAAELLRRARETWA